MATRPDKWKSFDKTVRDPGISAQAKGLYALLVSYADESGICWPGIGRLATEMGYTDRSIRNLLNELEDKGVIIKRRQGKRLTNLYSVTGNVVPITDKETGNPFPGDRKCASGVTGNSFLSKMASDLTPPSDSGNGTAQYNSPEEQPINNTCDKESQVREKGKSKSPKVEKETQIDERVNPVLKAFYEQFIITVNAQPTKQAFNWGRDGKRIKELPADYTTELLLELIPKFFSAPGYIARNYSFQSFLDAIPRLIKGGTGNGKHSKPAMQPSKDFSDYK